MLDAANENTLDKIKIGQEATIVRVGGHGVLRQRMLDMGLTHGAKVKLIRHAPLMDPIEIMIRGYRLSLRKIDASVITVK